jgi:4-hydroxy-tetrahydrodipicolinate synthase
MNDRQPGRWTDLAGAFHGVTVTTVTPFSPDGLDLDLPGVERNLAFLKESGVAVIVPAGNTGEFASLTNDEMAILAARTVAAVGSSAAVVVGVGGDIKSALRQAVHAQQVGAHGVMIHEPAHPFLTDDGLFAYYEAMCRAVDVGVAIYKRSPRVADRVLVRAARALPNVVAVKYAQPDVAAFLALRDAVPDRVTCVCGAAERWALPFSAAGRVGYTSGIANFAPPVTLRLWRALGEDRARARELWREIVPLEDLRAERGAGLNVAVIKQAMALRGLAAGPVRAPLSPLGDADQARVAAIIDSWDGEDEQGRSPGAARVRSAAD